MSQWNRAPYIKSKNFICDPIPRNGIPKFADSRANPKVRGTLDWQKYWEEQLYYIHNGYETGGMTIPGRYYYFMNFRTFNTIRGPIRPRMLDLHLELAYIIEYCKANGKNFIGPKGRRLGLSEAGQTMVVDYGYRFFAGYKAGVAAGQALYIDDFMQKWQDSNAMVVPEFKIKTLLNNDDETIAGYRFKDLDGNIIEDGTKNIIYKRTMFNNAHLFKGLYLNDIIAEEMGEFDKAKEFFSASAPCMMDGSVQVGNLWAYGCVCAGTKVWDNNGNFINIEDLKPENGIIGYDGVGASKEEITYWQPPREKPCYRITTNRMRTLECSEDHPILYSKPGSFNIIELSKVNGKRRKERISKKTSFREAKDLAVGDQVAIIESIGIYGNKKMWEPRLIGWLIGDGTYGIDHSPRIFNCDKEINNVLLTKFDSKVTRSHITKEGKIYEEIRIKGICGRLRELGIYGQTKLKKRLPKNVQSYSKKDICELLGGFFDTDGCICLGKLRKDRNGYEADTLTLTASSFDLLNETRFLLQKIGIHGSISLVKARLAENRKDRNDYYVLAISDQKSLCVFYENIKFSIKYKQDKMAIVYKKFNGNIQKKKTSFDGLRFERIVSIEYIGMKPIYNLTAGTTNTYVANGIVTHNTGGSRGTSSDAFEDMWHNHEAYNAVRMFLPTPRFYFPFFGGATKDGILVENVPNLQHLKPYERVGVPDEKAATEFIIEERARLLKAGDMDIYYDFCKNTTLDISEVFKKTVSNSFNIEKLNAKGFSINSMPKKYGKWKLEWVKNQQGEIKFPREVIAKPALDSDYDEDCVLILHDGHPVKGYKSLYVGGCLLPGEKVMTDNGLMDVEDVTQENKLINDKGELVKINELLRHNKIDEKVFKVTVSNTFRTTTFTSEHPILVSRATWLSDKKIDRLGLKFNYEKVSDINVGDWIKVPNIYKNGNDFDISDLWSNEGVRIDRISESPLYSSDFWWIVGLWLGDGWCGERGRITFAINIKEEEYAERLMVAIQKIFNRSASFRERNNCFEINFTNEYFNRFLCEHFGKGAIGKTLPEWAKRIDDACKKQLVLGYLDSDGCIALDKKRNLYNTQFVSINIGMLESFQDMLFSLGYVSQICKLRNAGTRMLPNRTIESATKETYQLRLGNEDTIRLVKDLWQDFNPKLKRVNFDNIKKTRKRAADGCFMDESLDYIYFQVRKIDVDLYSGPVYNFNCETHTFMCHHITTHNCDSYDQDKSKTSKSLGSMVVRLKVNPNPVLPNKRVVCLVRTRPKRKEIFYETCEKVSVYYGLRGNTLIDYAKPGIIQHYKDAGLESYLAKRPQKFEGASSTQGHDYGVSLNSYSKPLMVSLLQSYFEDYTDMLEFDIIIGEAIIYDEFTKDSDNDSIDALGISLMQEVSDGVAPFNADDKAIAEAYKYPEFTTDEDGDIVSITGDEEKEKEHFESGVRMGRSLNSQIGEVED